MSKNKYVVLDKNLVPMITRNVYGDITKCFLSNPVDSSSFFSPNLFLTLDEIKGYDERLLDFTYILERKNLCRYSLSKAFGEKEGNENELV